MTHPDPYAEVRAEFAAGLEGRVTALRDSLAQLRDGFLEDPAERVHRLAHSLGGTAASFEAERLAAVSRELEAIADKWRLGRTCPESEHHEAARIVDELAEVACEYVEALSARPVESATARLAVVGELAHLINATYDLPQIFRRAIVLVRRVLDFRRASVVRVDELRKHYVLHTLYDALRGGFITRDLSFSLDQGLTGQVIRTGQPMRVDDLEGREGILAQAGQRISAMLVPLHLNGMVIGSLNFGHEEPDRYTDDDLEWAGVLARQIEMSLHFSTLLGTIARQGEAIERERNQLEALIGASDAAIMLVRPDHTVAYANAEMTRLVGLPREAIVGASVDRLHDFLAASLINPADLEPQVQALNGGGSLRDRIELRLPDPTVYQRVAAPVRDHAGALIGNLVQYRDVTREAELERMKSEFVSVVSHELRTPMTSIKTSLALVLAGAAGALEPSARELLEIAARNSDRLIALVNDLLDLSRIEAGHVQMKLEAVSLDDAIRASIEMVGAFAAERGVAVAIRPTHGEVEIKAVRDRTIQVLVNLISNAVKFSPRGTQVRVSWWRDDDAAVIQVTDEGLGIPTDKLETVFEPFTQLASSITREQGGAGLGLTISRGIVQALGGRIWVESELGKGSRFYVRLPLATVPAPTRLRRTPEHSLRNATLLVIHSDPDWQRLCKAAFSAEGWGVVQAKTGEEGLAHLDQERVDLIALGLELSDAHGLTVLEQIRMNPRNCDVPTLIVGEGDVAHVVEYGADAWSSGEARHLVESARRLLAAPLRPSVLFVEDDPAVRDSIRKVLRRAGYVCLIASDPRQALNMLRIRRPALLMTDIRMPDTDGLSFLRRLREDPSLSDLPAIVLSGYVAPGIPEQVAALSARLLRKPVDLAELLAEIRELI
jgi:signal transduction histidine kinase/DNA-binding response OmpR family regulator/HPt (histidine-containing phosphotransfer) domain-containing protein